MLAHRLVCDPSCAVVLCVEMMTFILQSLYTAEMASILFLSQGTPAGSNPLCSCVYTVWKAGIQLVCGSALEPTSDPYTCQLSTGSGESTVSLSVFGVVNQLCAGTHLSVSDWSSFSAANPLCMRSTSATGSLLSDYVPEPSRKLLTSSGISSSAIEAFDKVRAGECAAVVFPNWMAEDALLYEANAACDMSVRPCRRAQPMCHN